MGTDRKAGGDMGAKIGCVTGADMGLGWELTKLGLEKGYDMVALVLREDGEKICGLSAAYPGKLTILGVDVTDEGAVEGAAATVAQKFPCVDFIVNNAGVLFGSKYDKIDEIVDLDVAKFRRTLDVNVTGMAIVLKYFMPLIYKSASPVVVNITSEAGYLASGGHNYLSYSVSKYAANMYSQKILNYLRSERPDLHVRLFMMHPGRMQTVMGAENAQIEPSESARGIYRVIDGEVDPQLDIPFINYKGEAMPH
ncbi:MAG: SDR family NAD(P)-dependent oxidoreductase [Lachnospiraceae bacterium]|jgi:NAD(P)-dependent dehydrogenase (short-subunit alcohol dehydrogenase family)|nr:SDR family NAD(P)-dependent oxidoreductase [Lachnospiraceae bacterium]